MKDFYEKRIDETRLAYLEALERLKNGTQQHPDLKGKDVKINASTIAKESGKSRNPLYHAHKDILEMINDIKYEDKKEITEQKESSIVSSLKDKIKELELENKRLLNVNATLLFEKKNSFKIQ
jgi:adenylosuccinate lyase